MSDAPRTEGQPSMPTTMPSSSTRYRVLMTLAVVVAALLLFLGVRATKSGDAAPVVVNGRPDVVERLIPEQNAEILQQTEIGIDLAPGYEGILVLDGITIPTDELRIVPEQNQVFFAPGPGRTFAALPSGQNCVTAIVWQSAQGRGPTDLSFRWCFDVT